MFNLRKLKKLDWVLIIVIIFLLVIGIAVIYSTTSVGVGFKDARSQIIFAVLGFLSLFIMAFLDYRVFRSYTRIMYVAVIGLLLFVLLSGKISHGSSRWIDLGFFQLQPSELAKLVIVIVLAKFFSMKSDKLSSWKLMFISLIYTIIPAILILLQPDLGTALVLVAIWFGMVLASSVRKMHILSLSVVGILSLPIVFQFLKEYQKKRIMIFLNPESDPQGAGYNVLQAIISIGSGRIFGRGLGHGPQSQLKFIPERHTDFIFAVLGEELGMLGGFLLLSLFGILLWRIVRAIRLSSDSFGAYLAIGIAFWILFQVFINVGMNIGIAPVTGIPLPLISYGGSSVIVILTAFGIIQSVLSRHKKLKF